MNLDENAGRRAFYERPAFSAPCVAVEVISALRAGVIENGVEDALVCWNGTTDGSLLLLRNGEVHSLFLLGRFWGPRARE